MSEEYIRDIKAEKGMVRIETKDGVRELTPRQAQERFGGTLPVINLKNSRSRDIADAYHKATKEAQKQVDEYHKSRK